ncbi:MAG: BlaI/MecI/CopY family transcriptional regulator, partial [Candidatus Poseidoniia archaeon]
FLRIMEEKELVSHTTRGRSFVYRAELPRAETSENLLSGMLDDVFDGALDALVASAFALKPPSKGELERLRELLAQHEQNQWRKR